MIQKWPEAVSATAGLSEPIFHTGIEGLDTLFPRRGIPYGQLIELTGADGSGKTSLLFMLLATLTKTETVIYIDFSGSFFPAAAASCGVDVRRLLIVTPTTAEQHSSEPPFKQHVGQISPRPAALKMDSRFRGNDTREGLRTAELLLSQQVARNIVIDLTAGSGDVSKKNRSTGRSDSSPPSPLSPPPVLLHRLRQQAARSKALVIFLTENDHASPPIIPASTVALRLEVERLTRSALKVTVTKSRISKEGAHAEVALHE